VVVICIIAAILSLMLKQYKPEYAMLLSMLCGVLVVLYLMDSVSQIKFGLDRVLSSASLPPELLDTVFKGLGICILSELASQSCRDAGETAIALKVELAGKVAITLLSMPLFLRLLEIAAQLLSG
ncbi:MAG: SpoIIIAC/SpoIIIAD family protein, partial [Angelakisella sp.]